jgi:hypothetical protein
MDYAKRRWKSQDSKAFNIHQCTSYIQAQCRTPYFRKVWMGVKKELKLLVQSIHVFYIF